MLTTLANQLNGEGDCEDYWRDANQVGVRLASAADSLEAELAEGPRREFWEEVVLPSGERFSRRSARSDVYRFSETRQRLAKCWEQLRELPPNSIPKELADRIAASLARLGGVCESRAKYDRTVSEASEHISEVIVLLRSIAHEVAASAPVQPRGGKGGRPREQPAAVQAYHKARRDYDSWRTKNGKGRFTFKGLEEFVAYSECQDYGPLTGMSADELGKLPGRKHDGET